MKQAEKVSIPKHKHCGVCSTPIGMDRDFCGQICEDQFKRSERKRKYTFIVVLMMFPILFFVLTLFHK
jgi:predicted nucleic acid-binding Zn ribbon protein